MKHVLNHSVFQMSSDEGEQHSPVLPRDSDRGSSVSSALQVSYHIHHHKNRYDI